MNKPILKLLKLEDFIEEVSSDKTDSMLKENVRIAAMTKDVPGSDRTCYRCFYVILTSIKNNGIVVEYEEEVGHEMVYFKDELQEMAKKTNSRKDEIMKLLEASGIKAKYGNWANGS